MVAMPSLFDPIARNSDPATSHLAAQSVKPANLDIIDYIRRALDRCGPLTQEQIAKEVGRAQPGRWKPGTIVTACARAGLHRWDTDKNESGSTVTVWSLCPPPIEDCVLRTDAL